ncbi:hypothetical protein BH09BAC2_BH09BAC2_16180 [soil metagenome]
MKLYKYSLLLLIIILFLTGLSSTAQTDTSATPIVKLHYYNANNSMQYLILESTLKKNKIFTPQPGKTYELYLDSSAAGNLIAKVKTDVNGKAKAFIPVTLKTAWDALPKHTFYVMQGDEEIISDYAIIKSKISIDTTTEDSVRKITATVMKLEGTEWVPAKEVEMKLGVQRHGGILSAGEEATYTTDSTGTVTVELNKLKLPGDASGNYRLMARVEDNEELGNLSTEKIVPWGIATKADTGFFDQRSLWSTRFRSPFWLLFMAYSIFLGVWGTLIYLMFQVVKIKKSGTAVK